LHHADVAVIDNGNAELIRNPMTVSQSDQMQVLIVEDSPAVKLYLETLLAKWGYLALTASDGDEAWHIIQSQRIHLVISDWMMPKVSGLDLCARIRSARLPHYVYTMLVTSRADSCDLVQGMRAGADDFLTKPINPDELQVRLEAARRVLALEAELERRNDYLDGVNRKLEQAQRVVSRDLQAAAQLQRGLLPEAMTVARVDLQSIFRPAAMVAGDIFGHFRIDGRRLAFFHIDVAGHGVPSAMLSFTLFKILTASAGEGSPVRYVDPDNPLCERYRSPAEVVAELNRRFMVEDDNTPYFTMVFGVVDTFSGALQMCQAGHPHPYRVSREGALESIGSGGFPVGLLPDAQFENIDIALHPGDRLFFYSDGVSECRSEAGEVYSTTQLQNHLRKGSRQALPEVLGGLTRSLRQWRGSEPFEDDISLLALEFLSVSGS
jgi:sigma-B regulation protein RsbU (phosphoserine phosphatase)